MIFCEPADLCGSPIWRFFCPYCGHWHTHGVGEGWRVAHCTDAGRRDESPYPYTGYYLKLDPKVRSGDAEPTNIESSWIDGYGRTVSPGELRRPNSVLGFIRSPTARQGARPPLGGHRRRRRQVLPAPALGRSDWRMGGEGGRPTAVQDARRPALPPRRRQGGRRDAASLHRRGRSSATSSRLLGKNDSVAITTCIDGARGWTPDITDTSRARTACWCRTTTSPDTIGSTR